MPPKTIVVPSETEVRTRISDAIKRYGLKKVARCIGLCPQATMAVGAGFPVQSGSLALATLNAPKLATLDVKRAA